MSDNMILTPAEAEARMNSNRCLGSNSGRAGERIMAMLRQSDMKSAAALVEKMCTNVWSAKIVNGHVQVSVHTQGVWRIILDNSQSKINFILEERTPSIHDNLNKSLSDFLRSGHDIQPSVQRTGGGIRG